MSTFESGSHNSGPATTNSVHHSKEDALDDRSFERLLEATYSMKDYQALEARFMILIAGRLGLRAGEICHIRRDWIDFRRRMIVIPAYQQCQKGEDGGICGYCRSCAKQRVKHNDDGLTMEEATANQWAPKTEAAAREVPFDAHPRAEMVVETYFEKFDSLQVCYNGIHRRLNRAAEHAEGLTPDDVRPHGLRATAATYFASRGLDVIALQAMFGWSDLTTAQNYIRRSGENTARAIRDIQV